MENADLPLGTVRWRRTRCGSTVSPSSIPSTSKLEFNPKFKREDGDVAVKSPDKANVFVSWGDLDKVIKKAPTIQDHAKFSLDRVKKSVQGKMTTLESKDIKVGGHDAVFNHVKIEVPRRGLFGKGQLQDVKVGPPPLRRDQEVLRHLRHIDRAEQGGPGPDDAGDSRLAAVPRILNRESAVRGARGGAHRVSDRPWTLAPRQLRSAPRQT